MVLFIPTNVLPLNANSFDVCLKVPARTITGTADS